MNNIRKLREKYGLSLRELESYVEICNTNIFYLENEKRMLRQTHIDKLTSFFNVTADYLLGKSNTGIIVYTYSGEKMEISDDVYKELEGKMTDRIVSESNPLTIRCGNSTSYILSKYVYREIDDNVLESLGGKPKKRLESIVELLSEEQCEMVLKFVENFVLTK